MNPLLPPMPGVPPASTATPASAALAPAEAGVDAARLVLFAELLAGIAQPMEAALPGIPAPIAADPQDEAASTADAPATETPITELVIAAIAYTPPAPLPRAMPAADAAPATGAGAVAVAVTGLPAVQASARSPADESSGTPVNAASLPADTAAVAEREPQATPPLPAAAAQPLHAAPASSPQVAEAPRAASAELRNPVHAPGWDRELGRVLLRMHADSQPVAELRLHPPELGPLQVVLRIGGEEGSPAQVSFVAPHAEARAALEAALPRLRELFAEAGLSLGQATVSAERFSQSGGGSPFGAGDGERRSPSDAAQPSTTPAARASLGVIDLFV